MAETLEDGWNVLSDRPSKGWNQREDWKVPFLSVKQVSFSMARRLKITKTLYEEVPR